jgi:hypothetical protein
MSQQQNLASIYMALIHNKEAQRYEYIRPKLEQLCIHLSQNYSATIIEVSSQPQIKPHSILITLLRDIIYSGLTREWRRYCLLNVRFLPLEICYFLMKSIKKYVFVRGRRSVLDRRMRNSFIDTVLTDKHIRVWNQFLESGADFLICFEDDAIFKDNSSEKVSELLDNLYKKNSENLIYADLAGGFDYRKLKIDKLEIRRDAAFRHYSKPISNTTCSYLINRPLVEIFVEMVVRNPWLRLIGPDWLLNQLFILVSNNGHKCICLHASPTIFTHGSFIGEYASFYSSDRQD